MPTKKKISTPIFNEYCSYIDEYKKKYGEQTLVLMQVGAFYEIYATLMMMFN